MVLDKGIRVLWDRDTEGLFLFFEVLTVKHVLPQKNIFLYGKLETLNLEGMTPKTCFWYSREGDFL